MLNHANSNYQQHSKMGSVIIFLNKDYSTRPTFLFIVTEQNFFTGNF